MKHNHLILSMAASLLASAAGAQQVPQVPLGIPVSPAGTAIVTTTTNPAASVAVPATALAVPVVTAPVTVVPVVPVVAVAATESQFTQSPAYKECTALAQSNPIAAEQKAAAWLQIDDGIGAHHCRAMALYGQRRFAEAAQSLAMVRGKISPGNVALRTYVARQSAKAWMDGGRPDAAIAALSEQITDMGVAQGNNAHISKLASELLLERAKLRVTYGQLQEAVKDLDQAVSLTPTDENVLMERAQAFAQLNDLALAKHDVASVLKLNPAHSKAQQLQRLLNNPHAQ